MRSLTGALLGLAALSTNGCLVAGYTFHFDAFTCNGKLITTSTVADWSQLEHSATDNTVGFCGASKTATADYVPYLLEQQGGSEIVLPCTLDVRRDDMVCCGSKAVYYTGGGLQQKCSGGA